MTRARTTTGSTSVTVSGATLTVAHLTLQDGELAAFVAERGEEDRGPLVERGLRVGLLSLRDAGVPVNIDYIQKEFERLLQRVHQSHEQAAEEVERSLRETFADGDG